MISDSPWLSEFDSLCEGAPSRGTLFVQSATPILFDRVALGSDVHVVMHINRFLEYSLVTISSIRPPFLSHMLSGLLPWGDLLINN